jgi:hypothetical protein
MRIAALVIYQVVTLSGGNISRVDDPGLCSKVLSILNCPAPLTAVPMHPEHRVTGCGETTVVTGEELCWWVNRQRSSGPEESLVRADDGSFPRLPNAAIRQQFLFTLLEDCSFFAHLVLRCVRARDGSHLDVAAPPRAKSRPALGIQRRTQPATCSDPRREQQDLLPAAREMSFPELEILWAEVVCRHAHISVSEGGE